MRQKRKLYKRIIHWIKRLFGAYKLHYKTIKGGCPQCGADLIVCEVAVMCSDRNKIKEINPNTGIVKYKCNYEIIAG